MKEGRNTAAPMKLPIVARKPHTQTELDDGGTSLSTSKVWVLPPRAKPGRKPAIDNCLSKRKVQNRDAQRAYRERRASKVTELEEELEAVNLHLNQTKSDFSNFQKQAEHEREMLLAEISSLKKRLKLDETIRAEGLASPAASSEYSHFEGRRPYLASTNETPTITDHRKTNAPSPASCEDPSDKSRLPGADAMEVDFTNAFPSFSTLGRADTCGFCSEDTPCVCEDVRLAPLKLTGKSLKKPQQLHPLRTKPLQVVSSAAPIEELGCTGNPGSCLQCQMDPMSTLFCATLAVASQEQSGRRSPCDEPAVDKTSKCAPSDRFIPCAEAYRTLSRHSRFASAPLTTLIDKLDVRGMKVGASSLASVLHELDRRLYDSDSH